MRRRVRALWLLTAILGLSPVTPPATAQTLETTFPDPSLERAVRNSIFVTYFYGGSLSLELFIQTVGLRQWAREGLQFSPDLSPEEIEQRIDEFLERVLTHGFGPSGEPQWQGPLTADLLGGIVHLSDFEVPREQQTIRSLEGIAQLPNLRLLILPHNQITDLSPLLALEKLEYVDVSWNPLGNDALTLQIPDLQARGVDVEYLPTAEPIAVPVLKIEVDSIEWENTLIGSSIPKEFTISNTGESALEISQILVEGSDAAAFSVPLAQLTIEARDRATVVVVFAPTSAGEQQAILSIAHNAGYGPVSIPLTGTGEEGTPAITLSPLRPDPNPAELKIVEGGTGYRYYQLSLYSGGEGADERNALPEGTIVKMTLLDGAREYAPATDVIAMDDREILRIAIDPADLGLGAGSQSRLDFASVAEIDGIQYEVRSVPSQFEVTVVEREYSREWDVFAEGSAGAGILIGGAGGGLMSASALRASIKGERGIGLKVSIDQSDSLELSRRVEAGFAVGLKAPAYRLAVYQPKIGYGAGGELVAKGIVTQTLKFDDPGSDAARLGQAGFLLESLSLGGLAISPIGGLVISGIVQALNELSGAAGVIEAARLSESTGGAVEGNIAAGFSTELGEKMKISVGELAGRVAMSAAVTSFRDGSMERSFEAAGSFSINPIKARLTLLESGPAQVSAGGFLESLQNSVAASVSQALTYAQTGKPLEYLITTTVEDQDAAIRLGQVTEATRYIQSVTGAVLEQMTLDSQTSGFPVPSSRGSVLDLGINQLAFGLDEVLEHAVLTAISESVGESIAYGYQKKELKQVASKLDLELGFGLVVGVGAEVTLGVKGSFLDGTEVPVSSGVHMNNGMAFPLTRGPADFSVANSEQFEEVLENLFAGIDVLLEKAVRSLVVAVTDVVEAGRGVVMELVDTAGDALAAVSAESGILPEGTQVQVLAYAPEMPRIDLIPSGKRVVRMKYLSDRVMHKAVVRGKPVAVPVQTVLTIVSKAFIVSIKDATGLPILDLEQAVDLSLQVREDDLVRSGFPPNDKDKVDIYFFDDHSQSWIRQNAARDSDDLMTLGISRTGTYALGIEQTSMDDQAPWMGDSRPSDGSTVDALPEVSVLITEEEGESGLDLSSLKMKLNGQVVAAQFDLGTSRLVHSPPAPMPDGSYEVQVTAADQTGNANSFNFGFTLRSEVRHLRADAKGRLAIPLDFRERDYVLALYSNSASGGNYLFAVGDDVSSAKSMVPTVPTGAHYPGHTEFSSGEDVSDPSWSYPPQRMAEKPTLGSANYQLGDRRDFIFQYGSGFREPMAFEVVALNERAVAFLQTNSSQGDGYLTAVEIQDILDEFLSDYYLLVARLGAPSDVDGDGKIAFLFTDRVDDVGDVSGFFTGSSVIPESKGGNGNLTDLIYISPTRDRHRYGFLLAHEFQHLINYNQHVLVRAGTEEARWLNEGLSHMAEDLVEERYRDRFRNIGRVAIMREFLEAPSSTGLVGGAHSDRSNRGAAYLFVRSLVDRFGEEILYSLVNTELTERANIEQATGENFEGLLAYWSAQLFASGNGISSDARLNYSFEKIATSVGRGLSFAMPATMVYQHGGDPITGQLQAAGVNFVRVTGEGVTTLIVETDPVGQVGTMVLPIPKDFTPVFNVPEQRIPDGTFEGITFEPPLSNVFYVGREVLIEGILGDSDNPYMIMMSFVPANVPANDDGVERDWVNIGIQAEAGRFEVWTALAEAAPGIYNLQLYAKQGTWVEDYEDIRSDTYWVGSAHNLQLRPRPGDVAVVEEDRSTTIPRFFALEQNYPNPFNSGTVIRFALPERNEVELAVYNLTGQRVVTLAKGLREAGFYTVHWDGRDDRRGILASGVYLYRLRTEDRQVATRKLMLIR